MRHHFQSGQNNRADRPSALPYLDQIDSQARKLQACLKPLAINDHLGQNSRPVRWLGVQYKAVVEFARRSIR